MTLAALLVRKGHRNKAWNGTFEGATLLIVMCLLNVTFGHLHITSVQG